MSRLGILLILLFQSHSFALSQYSLTCVDDSSNSIIQVIMNPMTEELLFNFEQNSESVFSASTDFEKVLNHDSELLRVYYKSFGFWNWKSVDLLFFPQFQVLRLVYRYKDTSWKVDTEIGGQTIDFTECESDIPLTAY